MGGLKMVDGVLIIKNIEKESININNLHMIDTAYGYKIYKIKNTILPNASISIKTKDNMLRIEGSLQYLLNQNSLQPTTRLETKKAITLLEILLGIDLQDAIVANFEFGIALEVPFKCISFFDNHLSLKKMDMLSYKNGKYFTDSKRNIKFYDAGSNAKKKLFTNTKSQLVDQGYDLKNKNYLKYEIKYLNPSKHFAREILVKNLFQKEFYTLCIRDLIDTYNQIQKPGIGVPLKKRMSTIEILGYILRFNESITKLDSYDQCIKFLKSQNLNSSQRSDRKRTLDNTFKKLSNTQNPYDISQFFKKEISKWTN